MLSKKIKYYSSFQEKEKTENATAELSGSLEHIRQTVQLIKRIYAAELQQPSARKKITFNVYNR